MKKFFLSIVLAMLCFGARADNLTEMQQKFVNDRFGMFIHFNMPTFVDQDWPDPDQPADTFNPKNLTANNGRKEPNSPA